MNQLGLYRKNAKALKSEQIPENAIQAYAKREIGRFYVLWRTNSGKIPSYNRFTHHTTYITLAPAGTPDLTGYDPRSDRFVGIECKTKVGKTTFIQNITIEDMKAAGCIIHVVHSYEDVDAIVDGIVKARGGEM